MLVYIQSAYLCKMHLQWVVCAQTDVETTLEKLWERVPLVTQEQGIV